MSSTTMPRSVRRQENESEAGGIDLRERTSRDHPQDHAAPGAASQSRSSRCRREWLQKKKGETSVFGRCRRKLLNQVKSGLVCTADSPFCFCSFMKL